MNSTVIGDYHHPTVRFSGSGGACDAGSLASAFIVFMQHGRRKFVEKLDYLTTPGWLTGGESRHHAGYRRGGPLAVVSDLGVMKFDDETQARCTSPSTTAASRRSRWPRTPASPWTSRARVEAVPPDAEELRILRDDVDPQRLILG